MDEKAQGSMEYLMLIGGAILASVVIIAGVINVSGTTKGSAAQNTNAYQSLIEQGREN